MLKACVKTMLLLGAMQASGAQADICQDYGGERYELKQTENPATTTAFCRIGSGPYWGSAAIVGAGAMERWSQGETTQAIAAFKKQEAYKPLPAGQGSGNPAIDYCWQMGGSVVNYDTVFQGSELGETGMCVFDDQSMIDEWTLMRHDANLQHIVQ